MASDNPAIALGGVHSLQQIAADYEEYRRPVFAMFCSYLRTNSRRLYGEGVIDELEEKLKEIEKIKGLRDSEIFIEKTRVIEKIKCPEIIKIISRNLFAKDSVFTKNEGYAADLEGCSLVNVDLNDCVLKHNLLKNTHLINCRFKGATMSECRLHEATMNQCEFGGATMTNCEFTKATMTNCWFDGTIINKCDFNKVTMSNRSFYETIMTNCWFDGTIINKCDFNKVMMRNCGFYEATMTNCRFLEAMMNDCKIVMSTMNDCEVSLTMWTGCAFCIRTTLSNCDFGISTVFTNCKGIPEEGLQGKVNICSIYGDELYIRRRDGKSIS